MTVLAAACACKYGQLGLLGHRGQKNAGAPRAPKENGMAQARPTNAQARTFEPQRSKRGVERTEQLVLALRRTHARALNARVRFSIELSTGL